MTTRRRILCGVAAALALVTTGSGPALAHSNGKVQLWVDHLGLHSGGANDWTVTVTLVDADSGTPQPGFDVAVEGSDDAGHSLAPMALTDSGGGRYTAGFTAEPGRWSLVVRGETRPGGTPGVRCARPIRWSSSPARTWPSAP
jgi:hypothetical protein